MSDLEFYQSQVIYMRPLFLLLLYFSTTIVSAQSLFTSGGKLNPLQAIMDVRHYKIALDVDISQKSISGSTSIDVIMKQPANTLLFNLLDSMNVSAVWVNGKKNTFRHDSNLVRIDLPYTLPAGRATVKIAYSGKPHVAIRPPWDDGFTWTTDSSGNPWVAVTDEASGGKLYFPCKDHPSDEPNEGVDMFITVPRGLVVAGPGLLQGVSTKSNRQTYHWKTQYTINNYSIVFNIGKYKVVSRQYTTIDGHQVPMQFYVLEEHAAKAPHHLDLFEATVHEQEKYFGEYPWVKEKIGMVETPHLGMEHQTMNAYGNKFKYTKVGGQDYDWLMHHEFGHEWWGNKVTVKDWADYWIHEGICSFGDALYLREMEGEAAYIKNFQRSALSIRNDKPVVMGKDIDEETAYHGDIYSKGAFFMHTLRWVMGDELFFPALKKFVTSPEYCYDNLVNTEDVQEFFSKAAGTDLGPLFDLYLRTAQKLEIDVKQTGVSTYLVTLSNIDMSLPVAIGTDKGIERKMLSKKSTQVTSTVPLQIDPDTYYLKKLIIE